MKYHSNERGTRINRCQIIEASKQLQPELRDWECPFCTAALPKFDNYHQKQRNVRRRFNTKHPRRDTSTGAIQKARWKKWKRDKQSPNYKRGFAQKVATRLQNDTRNLSLGGHKLHKFLPNWPSWPQFKSYPKGKGPNRKGFLFTCLTCLKVGNYNQKQWGTPCQGSKAPPSSRDVCRWKKLQKPPTNRDMLLGLWKITKSQADKKFDRLVEQGAEPHPGPLANEPKPRSSCPSTRQTSTVPMHRYLQCQPACRGSHVKLTAGVSPRRESKTGPMQITAKHVCPASMQKQNVFTLSQNSLRGGAQKINGNPTQNPDGSNNGCDEMTDNEESDDPDPTPSGKTFGNNATCRSDAQILSVNVRDAPGLWRLLKVITDNPTLGGIWCIQEPCLRPDDFITVHQKFSQLGFRAHHSIGKNGQKAAGGVLIAVRSTIPHQVLHKQALDDHQHLLISCSSWLIGSSYIPPRQNLIIPANQTLSSILSKFQASAGDRPWLHTGDFNLHPVQVKAVFAAFQGELLLEATRWKSTHPIDHIWTNAPQSCSLVDALDTKIADHKILRAAISLRWSQETHRLTFVKAHRWSTPPGIATSIWTKHLEEVWTNSQRPELDHLLQIKDSVDSQELVDTTWRQFNLSLHELFRTAASTVPEPAPVDHHAFQLWKNRQWQPVRN